MIAPELIERLKVRPGKKVKLEDHDTGWAQSKELKELGKDAVKARAAEVLEESRQRLAEAQELLYASDSHAVLMVLQAMDAAGKDGTIKHVMGGVNPQGCQVFSFKKPSAEELDHTFLWRCMKCLPERGRIGIFNRSYYEDVLVVKVHPEFLDASPWPPEKPKKSFWEDRYEDINAFERHLVRNGTVVLKFFLHVSKDEQKKRFLERLENADKHWKFSVADMAERRHWDAYTDAYEDCLEATSTDDAPWYVIPADHKWVSRSLIADVLVTAIQGLGLSYPKVSAEKRAALDRARAELLAEK